MAKYRKISTRIWNDDKFSLLSCDAKLLFFFLLSHPHMTPLGAMRANSPGIAHELSWPLERLSEALREVSTKGMVSVDERVSCVFLPNFVKHNLPESPNVILAWEKCLDDIPDCSLKNKAIHTAREVSLTMSEAFRKAYGRLSEVFHKGMPNQEQEPEQEPEPLKAFCAEPQKDEVQAPQQTEPPLIVFPLSKRGEEQAFYQNDIDQWRESFPGVDLRMELLKCRQWNIDNPTKRKTRSGIRTHISSWLGKAQNGQQGINTTSGRNLKVNVRDNAALIKSKTAEILNGQNYIDNGENHESIGTGGNLLLEHQIP